MLSCFPVDRRVKRGHRIESVFYGVIVAVVVVVVIVVLLLLLL